MREIDIDEVLEKLDTLVEEAAKGEAFIITKAGAPVARVEPFEEPTGEHGTEAARRRAPAGSSGF